MPYISLDNLTQYNGRLRDYIDGSFDKLDGANWRKTSAAQSVSCWPIPESPLEPEVTFKFSETPPASGTKGPDNPSTIVGVEAVACHVCEAEGVNDTPYFIGLGDTYYGGTVNFATGVMEVTWFEHTFDGTEVFHLESTDYETCSRIGTTLSGTAPAPATQVLNTSGVAACTHYPHRFDWGDRVQVSFHSSGFIRFFTPLTIASTVAELQAFFAQQYANGTPVKLAYPIASPYTVQLTPQQIKALPALSHYAPRQNTIYTPHESVQVGYAKSALKTSEELTNAIISLGGNV